MSNSDYPSTEDSEWELKDKELNNPNIIYPKILYIQNSPTDWIGNKCELIKEDDMSLYYAYCKGTCSKIHYISKLRFDGDVEYGRKNWFLTREELKENALKNTERNVEYIKECIQSYSGNDNDS